MNNTDKTRLILDIKALHQWFFKCKRDLPWRSGPDPYRVWISEVMLQQTQVAVVVPYFERWIKLFPCVQSLAEAPLDQVIKAWEGLGYYSRARHLHQAARYIMENFEGNLPATQAELEKIKGLGPYTSGAVLSFAFHVKVPAVDGNVMRVLSRYFWMNEDISRPQTVRLLRKMAAAILPEHEHWVTNEALIELGATVCKKNPHCAACPLGSSCAAFAKGRSAELPYKSTKIKSQKLLRAVPVILSGEKALVKRGEKGKVMSDLYEFPYFEILAPLSLEEFENKILEKFKFAAVHKGTLPSVAHGFTRYHATLFPEIFHTDACTPVEGYTWLSVPTLGTLAFSSGHRQILHKITLSN